MKTTTDHGEIRRWVESRGGKPAVVPATPQDKGAEGLQIDFPDKEITNLKPISWDEWFQAFEQHQLAFLFNDSSSPGDHPSCTLVSRATV